MLGTWRLILALLVVVAHLHGPPWVGHYAVFSFYVISGFLMTLIMQEKYGYAPAGFFKYLLNRFLRIYPPFWLGCGLTLLLIATLPTGVPQAFRPTLQLPDAWGNLIAHITLLGLDHTQDARLVPPAWALHVEVFYYLAIGAGIGRTRSLAIGWFILSIAYLIWLNNSGMDDYAMRYYVIPAGSLPFSVGCLLYHFRDTLARWVPWRKATLAWVIAIYLLPWILAAITSQTGISNWFYLNIFTSALLVHVLFIIPRKTMPKLARCDTLLGDLCYPVYLMHWQAGLIVVYLFSLPNKSLLTLLGGLTLVIIFALLEASLLSRPLDRLRKRIAQKPTNRRNEPTP